MFSELSDCRRDALIHRAVGIFQPRLGGGRACPIDVGEHILDELLEVVGPRHEIRLAIHFDEDARLLVGGELRANHPFARRPSRLLGRAGEPPLAKDRRCLLEVAVGLLERALAVHHAGAGLVAEFLDLCCADCHVAFAFANAFTVQKNAGRLAGELSRFRASLTAPLEPET